MKKIQLTDGLPTNIRKEEQSDEVNELVSKIEECCKNSELSYWEINKALYLVDKELYLKTITRRHNV